MSDISPIGADHAGPKLILGEVLLKYQLYSELDDAGAAGAGHFSECRRAECQPDGTGLTKIWSIHDVKELRPELKIHPFPNAKVLKR